MHTPSRRARLSATKAPNEKQPGAVRLDRSPLAHRDQLQEHARELHDAVLGPPRMPVARPHREAQRLIKPPRGIEVADGDDEVVETAGMGGL